MKNLVDLINYASALVPPQQLLACLENLLPLLCKPLPISQTCILCAITDTIPLPLQCFQSFHSLLNCTRISPGRQHTSSPPSATEGIREKQGKPYSSVGKTPIIMSQVRSNGTRQSRIVRSTTKHYLPLPLCRQFPARTAPVSQPVKPIQCLVPLV